jgi:hypothetical protein
LKKLDSERRKMPEIRVPAVERRALKQARFAFKKRQFVFNAGCCKDVKSKSKFKLTASRSSKT